MNSFRISACLLLWPILALAQPAVNLPPANQLPSLSPLVEAVRASVVNVEVQARTPQRGGEDSDDLFEHFFGLPGGRRQPRPLRQGAGSGFIIEPSGLVLTNNHVVEGAVVIRVKLDDGRSFDGQVLGRDPLTDVAVLKLKGAKNLPSVKLGDSDAMKVGDWVVAIGNPFGLASSVSLGIVSARAREIGATQYDDFLQTDAAINPGNSGGPLFNLKGEVIGINTAITSSGAGIGFAVPSNLARALLPQLEKGGAVTRGWLGVGIQSLNPELAKALNVPTPDGALVGMVNDGSPAQKAGLLQDDVVTAVDGQKVHTGSELSRIVAFKRPGSTVALTVFRGGTGKPKEVKVVLGTRPEREMAKEEEEKAPAEPRTRLGLGVTEVDPRYAQATGQPPVGALIVEVVPGSVAERAGLAPGQVVIEANKKPVKSRKDLLAAIQATPAGQTLLLRVRDPRGATSLAALTMP